MKKSAGRKERRAQVYRNRVQAGKDKAKLHNSKQKIAAKKGE